MGYPRTKSNKLRRKKATRRAHHELPERFQEFYRHRLKLRLIADIGRTLRADPRIRELQQEVYKASVRLGKPALRAEHLTDWTVDFVGRTVSNEELAS